LHPAGAFHQTEPNPLAELIAKRGLAVIIGVDGGRAIAAHAPVLTGDGVLRFHLSAANRLIDVLERARRALAVVTGPDAYVSPDWYAAADQVPTWNYLSAEVEGPVRRLDRAAAARLLDDLSAHFEARLAPKPPWSRTKMTPARFETLLRAIVAYEMYIERFEGIAKLSQNKPTDEIARVAAKLAGRDDEGSRQIARLMVAPRTYPAR
jgi:transcriptional regulator